MTPRPSLHRRLVMAFAGALLAAAPASAQVDPSRLLRNVFNTPESDRTGVTLTVTFAEGYGDSPESYAGRQDRSLGKGVYSELTPSIAARAAGEHGAVAVSARTSVRYDDGSFAMWGRSVGFGAQTEIGRTALRVDQTLATQPFYAFAFGGTPVLDGGPLGEVVDPLPDQAALPRSEFVSLTSGAISRQMQRYLWLSGQYSYRSTSISEFAGGDDTFRRRHGEHRATVSLGRQLTRLSRLRFGYEFRTLGAGADGRTVTAHNLIVGFDRGQALKLTRYTLLTFSFGPALVETQSGTGVTGAGSLSVRQQLSRGWYVGGSLQRGLVYAEGFERPMMMNGYGGTLNGVVGRRVTVRASYGASRGYTDLTSLSAMSPQVSSVSARAGMEVALGRHFGAFLEYWLYRQTIDTVMTGVTRPYDDYGGVRAGLLYRVPLFGSSERGER